MPVHHLIPNIIYTHSDTNEYTYKWWIKQQQHHTVCIKTHDSELRGQEEAGRTQRTSKLFTGSTAVKFVNALNKPP